MASRSTGDEAGTPAPQSAEAIGDADTEGRRARAELAALGDLIAVFAHDLSNPLQSLTVLLELVLDDLPENSDEHTKLRQSLEATDRMRRLVRDFAGLTRASRRAELDVTCEALVSRVLGVLQRRFERHNVRTEIDLGAVEQTPVPARAMDMGLLNVMLAVVHTASDSPCTAFELTLHGSVPAKLGGNTARIEVGLAGHDTSEQTLSTLRLSPVHIERAEDTLRGSSVTVIAHPNDSIRLEFPVGATPQV